MRRGADLAPDLVADHVAGERRSGQQQAGDDQLGKGIGVEDLDLPGRKEEPDAEQHGVTGTEREAQPALDADAAQADPDPGGTEEPAPPPTDHAHTTGTD